MGAHSGKYCKPKKNQSLDDQRLDCSLAIHHPRSQSSPAISDMTSPVKLVGKIRGSKPLL